MKNIKQSKLFGYDFIHAASPEAGIEYIFDFSTEANKYPVISTLNVDQIVKFEKNDVLKTFIKKSQLTFADGQPLVWVSNFTATKLPARITGSDLFPLFWKKAKEVNATILCVVPNEQVAAQLKKDNNAVECWVAPFVDYSNDAVVGEIIDGLKLQFELDSFDFIVVGIGLPNRELLTKALVERGFVNSKYLLFGAAFEFYLGIKKRAPKYGHLLGVSGYIVFYKSQVGFLEDIL
ncbi:WecB/TagA/CpsF family glycosyltransferase [Pseudoalteromonas sp. B62]